MRGGSVFLSSVAPELEAALNGEGRGPRTLFSLGEIRRQTQWVRTRDGFRLATELYLPPGGPAPTVILRTPYGRTRISDALLALARAGYAVVSQDCRGTGDSEPDTWDYYVYESEDSFDLVAWTARQPWCDGFIAGLGGSYAAQCQWGMALHPAMSAIAPQVSGLGVAVNTARLYNFIHAYGRSVGKSPDVAALGYDELERRTHAETIAGGFFDEPLWRPLAPELLQRFPQLAALPPTRRANWLWRRYCRLACAERAAFLKVLLGVDRITIAEVESLPSLFGQGVAHDAHTLPTARRRRLFQRFQAPALMITGWYDWGLNDALATWNELVRHARPSVAERSRLVVTPSAHNLVGFREGEARHPELRRTFATPEILDLLQAWWDAQQRGGPTTWPKVVYYLMGANTWMAADQWPPSGVVEQALHLRAGGGLTAEPPGAAEGCSTYVYDPQDPTPTVGGSIVSFVYTPGSCDVAHVQARSDVLTFTTGPLAKDLDVAGPLRVVLHVRSSAPETDFVARLSAVLPDGRAIQIQNGLLRTRHRNLTSPRRMTPNRTYALEIDMWATAFRFAAGSRLRVDISSADFPRFERNANRGGEPGSPVRAMQTICHDARRPSRIVLSVLPAATRKVVAP